MLGILLLIAGLQVALVLGALMIAGGFGSASSALHQYLLLQSFGALPWLACTFLMPAFAASSITPDREQRRIAELILAGLTPRQILVSKGLGAILPFLVIAAAGLAASWVAYWSESAPDPAASYGGFSPSLLLLSQSTLATIGWPISAAIEVCISALSRRTSTALVICYGFQCLLIPILGWVSQLVWILLPTWGGLPASSWNWTGFILASRLTTLLLEAVLLLVLWPRALQALAYPD